MFGGAITATTGIIAKHFGAEIGGLFLAFPAIFPASATLIEKHEKDKKRKAGLDGTNRGREAAGLDAAGAALGSIGLIGFATVFWALIPRFPSWPVLICATLAWALFSGSLWYLRKKRFGMRTLHAFHGHKHPKVFPSARR
jgi:hypothetical protein